MKIDGTEAGKITYQKTNDSTEQKKYTKVEAVSPDQTLAASTQQNIDVLNISEVEKMELSISDKAVFDAIERANKAISISGRKFEYSIHEKTKQIMIKVINSDTNEIIREIPSEKILDMVANMWEMAGLIVDERG